MSRSGTTNPESRGGAGGARPREDRMMPLQPRERRHALALLSVLAVGLWCSISTRGVEAFQLTGLAAAPQRGGQVALDRPCRGSLTRCMLRRSGGDSSSSDEYRPRRKDDDDDDDDDLSLPLTIPRNIFASRAAAPFVIPNEMGVGTMSWGDTNFGFVEEVVGGSKSSKTQFDVAQLKAAYEVLVNGGVTFFDTAEVYGRKSIKMGMSSEQLLGQFSTESSALRPVVATKYMPVLWTNALVGGGFRAGRRAVVSALQRSLDRLDLAYADLYQLHFPFPYVGGFDALAEGLARAKDRGLCRHVGVSNMNGAQVRAFKKKLDKWGVPLVSNQVEFSLSNQRIAEDGTIATCKALGVQVLAHTPLGRGLATGTYTATNPTGGKPGTPKYVYSDLAPLAPVHQALAEVAKSVTARVRDNEEIALKSVTTTQVSLNYVRAKGLVPLPGVSTVKQAKEVVGCIGWELNGDEVEILDNAYKKYRQNTGGQLVTKGKDFDPLKRLAPIQWTQKKVSISEIEERDY
jgi:aryl-alcohol dehydrogenase-like predicted oxidoreductase